MTDRTVLLERRDAVAIVTLNRPQAMNALSGALRLRLVEVLAELDADPGIRAVVLTGAGNRAFCAGLDLKELGSDPNTLGSVSADAAAAAARDPVRAIRACRHPVIAAVNGVAVTGGFELALACDILLASSNARFADTHARIGVMPGWGLSQVLPRLIGPSRAKELSLSGRFLDAATALAWGLVNCVTTPEALLDEAAALAAAIAEPAPDFVQAYKRLIDDGLSGTLSDGLALEKAHAARWNAAQAPEALEARRSGVLAHGRAAALRPTRTDPD